MPDLKVKLCHQKAGTPYFATDGAACFDIIATSRKAQGQHAMLYGTGLKFDIPKGYHIAVYSRSGHGFRDDMRLCNSTGIVDEDYRGEVMVKLTHDGLPHMADWPMVGDRVAQAMLVRNVKTNLVRVEELSNTERGEGGFGSTGK
jgi:dUTP pyrophosphatase